MIRESIKNLMLNTDFLCKTININMNKIIQHESIKALERHFDFHDELANQINCIMEEQIGEIANEIDSWLLKMLNVFGVHREEIGKRVAIALEHNCGVIHMTHVFIDGIYEFSYSTRFDFTEDKKAFCVWIKAEYVSSMEDR